MKREASGATDPLGRAEPAAASRSRRLFFALWPDAAMRERLARAVHGVVRGCGGRPVPLEQLHLTLAFLGAVPEVRLQELIGLAAALPDPGAAEAGLELSLDRLVHWPQPQVLCALPTEPPSALGRLARGLSESLTAAGFAPDVKPFRAHVTVARKVVRPSEPRRMRVIRWQFERFALIESRTLPGGVVYSVVETYPLCSGAPARK